MSQNALVIGAGIVGLATARALSIKGWKVKVIERTEKAVGASIRNFGMVWPIGQPEGILYERALKSRSIWKEIADKTGIWYDPCGSIHLAYEEDEWAVLQELEQLFSKQGRPVNLLNKAEILHDFNHINHQNLIGGLYSGTEMIVEAREAIANIPKYLEEFLNVQFIWGKTVTSVETGKVYIGNEIIESDLICVCSGADLETLYPEYFSEKPITKCKLQMMRFEAPGINQRIGAAICGGLSLIHYDSFKVSASLQALKKRYETELWEYIKWGIHVMVSQNGDNALTVGDTHEYGKTFDPFDKSYLNQLVFSYLKKFALCDQWKLSQTWNGIYSKMTNGQTELVCNPEPGVIIINGLGGAGMTLSFGLAQEVVDKM